MSWNEEAVVAGIYDAALHPQRWSEALQGVAAGIGASSAFFFSTHSDTQPDAVVHTLNYSPEMVQSFGEYWHTEDEWANAARRAGRMCRGTLVRGCELVPASQMGRTAFYNEFCRPHGVGAMVGGVLFDGSEADTMPFVNLCWYRPPGHDEFEDGAKDRLRALMPHFQRALRIQRRVAWATDARAAQALAALRVATIVLDRTGEVHFRDAHGDAWLRSLPSGSWRMGKLRTVGRRSAPALAVALAQCRPDQPVRLAALDGSATPRVVRATLLHLDEDSPIVPAATRERYLLLVELPLNDPDDAVRAAAELYGLTNGEARVLARLMTGESPAEIAVSAAISIATVRTHLSNLFGKTGTKGQVELILLLRGLMR
jgi:DNA-binding CsgD family transcriptional regulator